MKQKLLFLLSAVIRNLSVTARDSIIFPDGKITDNAISADRPDGLDSQEPCKVDTKDLAGESAEYRLDAETSDSYGEWADWQTTDVTKIRKFFANYGFDDTQTAVDKGIVKVQRRFSQTNSALSQLKLVDVFGDVDLIANVNTAETETSQVVFPDQDTGIPNTRGGSYETYHFFARSYTNFSCYEDGAILLDVWGFISPQYGFHNLIDYITLIFPGKWDEPVASGRYIPETETYDNVKSLISELGNAGVTWEDAVDFDCSENLEFPNRKQYTFHKLVGGTDIPVDIAINANGTVVLNSIQNTGFIFGGDDYDGTEELKLYVHYFDIYEATHSFVVGFRLFTDPDSNYYPGVIHLTKEGHEMLSAKVEGKDFIPSTQKSVTFSTPHSGEVDEWRLYIMSWGAVLNYNNEFYKAMQGEEAKISYAVVGGDNITIPCDTLNIHNDMRLVPMNMIEGKMKQSGPYAKLNVHRNVPLAGEWEEWGEGKMTDVIAFPYLGYYSGDNSYSGEYNLMPPAERMVRIERRKDAPGIIRIPDPYKGNYPYKDKMEMIDTDDIFYLVIDTTDPSRVTAEYTLTGTSDGSCFYVKEIDPKTKYGICFDKKVIFRNNLAWNTRITNLSPYDIPQLSLELPDYKDYTVAIKNQSDDMEQVEIENMSENVTSVDMALVPADEVNPYYPEFMCERVMNRSEDLIIHNYPIEVGKTLSVSIAELAQSVSKSVESLPTGEYRVVTVPREADGTPHYGPTSKKVKYAAPWKYLGMAEINDKALVWSPADVGVEMKAEAYEDPYTPGFYMLKDCYRDYAANNKDVDKKYFSEYVPSSLYIDARNPKKVNLVADAFFGRLPYRGFNTGVSLVHDPVNPTNDGYHYIQTMGNYINSSDDKYYGKKEGDYILFDRNNLITTWDGTTSLYYAKSLTIKLPHVEEGAVEGVESDADSSAPVQWYNLQGVRVDIDNVPSGVYIRRQGNAASKVAVRR